MTYRECHDPEILRAEVVRLVSERSYTIRGSSFLDPRDLPDEAKLVVLACGTRDRRSEGDATGVHACDAWLDPYGFCTARYAIDER